MGDLSETGGVVIVALAAASACLICLMAGPIGRFLGLLDVPDGRRKLHDKATPLVGGCGAILPVAGSALALAWTTPYRPLYLTLGLLALGFLALGLVDDRRHLRPLIRLLVSVALVFAAVQAIPALGLGFLLFSFRSEALFLDGWTLFFTVVCLVGLQNAVNMADGKNGLAPGICLIWTMFVSLYAPAHLQPLIAVLLVCLAVVFAFNLAGRLFLGDSGVYALSVLVGVLAIHTYGLGFATLTADVVALWFLVPVLDCLRLIVARMSAGASPFRGDRNHLHHYIANLMPWRYGLVVYLGLVAGPGALAYVRPGETPLWGVVAASCYLAILGLGARERRAALG